MRGDPTTIGDNICHGFNNNFECDFDGMDCCRPVIDDSLCHDMFCRCHLTGIKHPTYDEYQCTESAALVGDGICDDKLNKAECFFDYGDCCNPASDRTFCTDCTCHADELSFGTYQGNVNKQLIR